jgi:hypothetical protein
MHRHSQQDPTCARRAEQAGNQASATIGGRRVACAARARNP